MFHVSWLLLRSAPPQNPVAGPGGPPMWVWLSSHAVGINLHWIKTILSNWIFQQIECYFFPLKTFAVSSQLPKKKKKKKSVMRKKLIIYSICHWKNDSLNVMDSKLICFYMFLWHGKYGSSKNLDLIRLDAIQLRKKPLYTCS